MLLKVKYVIIVKGSTKRTAATPSISNIVYRSLKSPYITYDQKMYTSLGVLSIGVLDANMKNT